VGGADGDGAWRGVVMFVEFINPRPYTFQTPAYGSLIYTVIYVSDRLLTQTNPVTHFTTLPDLRRMTHPTYPAKSWTVDKCEPLVPGRRNRAAG
jgi:hypothetical protein